MIETAIWAAIASPRRREILRLVWNQELAAGAIHAALPDVTFGAISLQLQKLGQAGLVTARVDGRHRFYRASRAALGPVARMLEHTWNDALARLKLHAELEQARRGPRGLYTPRSPSSATAARRRGARSSRAAKGSMESTSKGRR